MKNVIVTGRMGAGKSTVAEMLVEEHGFQVVSIAALLKDIAVQIWGPGAEKRREYLQPLGMAVRDIDPDAWINVAVRKVQEENAFKHPCVIDDCRFVNELEALQATGAVTVRVTADRDARVGRLLRNGKMPHDPARLEDISETSLDGVPHDIWIYNNSDYRSLQPEVSKIVAEARK